MPTIIRENIFLMFVSINWGLGGFSDTLNGCKISNFFYNLSKPI
jgi:hypothetical protein